MTPVNNLRQEGQEAFDNGDYELAVQKWSDLYDSDRTFENNQLFARALSRSGQPQAALTVAKEYVGEYLGQKKDYQFYFDLCLNASYFIMARRMAMESIEERDKNRRIKEVEEAEKKAKEEHGDALKKIARRFHHISGYDALEQQQIYQDAMSLPIEDYVDAARTILKDPYTLPLVQASILSDIQCLILHQNFTYCFLDGKEYTTVFCEHPRPLRDPNFEAARNYLIETVGQEDPVAFEMLMEQLKLEMHVLFPQIDRIENPIAWVQSDMTLFNDRDDQSFEEESEEQKNLHLLVHRSLEEMGAS
ncbi:hypothetical protein G6R29_06355 [Fructobacillus sp. M2-14]|uniref:TPR repeat-containing protein n=1 Tax=Fructobacillus broussonetiae TaxID=2713173 RepID=A0ABS5R1B9_9LACO|nr:hypothetical protein [Fructobacillus broussonetiae]MBS9339225.1 hypothetical protein [Fructobacillus broussonetiae]